MEPAFSDCCASPLDERLAKIAARAVTDQVEWTFKYYEKVAPSRLNGADFAQFRRLVFGQCPELGIMRDIADAARHRFLQRPNAVIETSTDAYIVRDDQLWVKVYERPFLDALSVAVDFWRGWPD